MGGNPPCALGGPEPGEPREDPAAGEGEPEGAPRFLHMGGWQWAPLHRARHEMEERDVGHDLQDPGLNDKGSMVSAQKV